jgi:hypothetical protein
MSLKVKERKVQLPRQAMRAEFAPSSFDKGKRTIDLIWSVGSKGLRGFWEQYYEELSMDPAHVRMGRLESGATPFIDAHASYSTQAVLGVVESARIENGVGTATVRLVDPDTLENPDAKDTIRKIESGILKNISVGYNVYRYDRQPAVEGEEIPTYLAVDWEPVEISIVPVGFDQSAVVRGKEKDAAPCVIIERIVEKTDDMEVQKMTEEQKRALELKQAEEKAAAEKIAADQARAAEKARATEIRKIFAQVRLPSEMADKAVNEDKTVDQAREIAQAALAKQTEESEIRNAVATGGKPALVGERKLALENALLHRASPGLVKLTDEGRNFRGMSLLEMARDFLSAGGVQTRGMSKMELAARAFHSTSDFPEVLANVAGKSLRKGYDEAPRTFTGWAKEAQLPDFKQVSRASMGEAPALEKVLEGGEIKKGTMGEGAEKYSLATYAKIVAITRQVIINDDLGAFTSLAQKFGFAAASLESDVVYAILTANAALSDTVALFHATHANLAGAAVPSITTLAELRKLIRLQKGTDGARPLNLMGKYVIVPAALELAVLQLMAQVTPNQASQVNPFQNLVPVVEPRLDAASASQYYMTADPNQVDTVEYGYLEGQQGVYTETRQGFEVDGMEIKARLDFAAKAIDHRGMARNG